ncbi:methyltransferase domain-containing protein [Singulisphaera rosea]
MKLSGERYFPRLTNPELLPFEPFISYEHWHRYFYAVPFIAGKVVLDIASGEGYGSAFLSERAARVCGVDVSEEAVEHASEQYRRDNLQFFHGSAEQIPIPGEHVFDVIVSFETIEHLDADAQARFAAEVRRLLKPDGVFLLSTPNRITYNEGDTHSNPYHLHEFTREEFLDYLRESFQHVHLLSQHVYPMSYIWNLDHPGASNIEYQMTLVDGGFRPCDSDQKEVDYLIAVCTNRDEDPNTSDSVLVDLSETAFRGIRDRERWQLSSLFLDTGFSFRAEEVRREQVEYNPEFEATFILDSPDAIRQLRWDPLESRLCLVHIREVVWEDDQGKSHALDLDAVTSNGVLIEPGTFRFETLDPMIYLPVTGAVTRLTIRGECRIEGETGSLLGLEKAIVTRNSQLIQRDHELKVSIERVMTQDQSLEEYRRQLKETTDRFIAAERRLHEIEHTLGLVLNSKRWAYMNRIRSVYLYFSDLFNRRGTQNGRRHGPHRLQQLGNRAERV